MLKAQLLKRFRLTEGGYRKKFKSSKLELGETPDQFIERLRRYLIKWREMAGYQGTYEDLEDMILRDHYFLTCDNSLQTFLKEKGKMSLKHICKASDDYYDAHGYPADNHEHKDNRNGPNKPFNQYKGNGTQINSSPPKAALHCDNCGLNNHNTSECRKPRGNQRASNNNTVCFACNKTGHKRNQCPTNKVTHMAAAMQQIDSERSHGGHLSPTRPHQCDNVQSERQKKDSWSVDVCCQWWQVHRVPMDRIY